MPGVVIIGLLGVKAGHQPLKVEPPIAMPLEFRFEDSGCGREVTVLLQELVAPEVIDQKGCRGKEGLGETRAGNEHGSRLTWHDTSHFTDLGRIRRLTPDAWPAGGFILAHRHIACVSMTPVGHHSRAIERP